MPRATPKPLRWARWLLPLALLSVLLPGYRPGGRPAVPPDIVLVVIDTLRADHLGLYGHGRATSPRLDALGERSVVFERAFSHSGWTLPSFGTLLTGRHPVEHGLIRHPDDPQRFGKLDSAMPTVAERLAERGYRTAAFVNNVFLAPEFGLGRGFDRYDYVPSSNDRHRSAERTVEAVRDWLAAGDAPAFVLVHFMEPHIDYAPPASTRGRFTDADARAQAPVTMPQVRALMANDARQPSPSRQEAIRRVYDEEILAADRALGRLVDLLEARERPTWTVITADHGEEFWDHGGFEHGHSLHGELVHVPLVLHGPRLEPATIAAPVQHADVFQTLFRLAAADAPAGTHGRDLLDVIDDPQAVPNDRPLLSEDCLYGTPCAALTAGRMRAIVDLKRRRASLWRLDERGRQDTLVTDPATEEEHLWPLMETLFELRGTRELREVDGPGTRLRPEDIERLRALGYIR